jgi:hypothetical protein
MLYNRYFLFSFSEFPIRFSEEFPSPKNKNTYKVIHILHPQPNTHTPKMQITLKNLEQLKTAIESLQPNHQVEILRILHKHGVKINSSKSGICVNLTPLSSDILEELKVKVDFIRVREQTLDDFEKKTEEYKTMTTSYKKEDKEKMLEFPTRV